MVMVEYTGRYGVFAQHRILDKEYWIDFASHAQYELVFLIKGKMELNIKGDKFSVGAGEMIVLDLNVLHAQRILSAEQTELMVVNFPPEILPYFIKPTCFSFIDDNPMLNGIVPADICRKYKFYSYFRAIIAYARNKELKNKETMICAEIIKLVSMLNMAINEVIGYNGEDRVKKGFILDHCIKFINANISKRLTINDIAENMFVGRSYLQHVFKKEMGMSISEYITKQKMTIAKSLLEQNYKATVVATKLGYDNYTTFRIKYKKFYGITPRNVLADRFFLACEEDEETK